MDDIVAEREEAIGLLLVELEAPAMIILADMVRSLVWMK